MKMIGLHKDGKNLLFARIRKKRNGSLEIERLSSQPQKNKKSETYVSGLDASDVLIKNISLKIPSKTKLQKVLPLQKDSLYFFGEDESITIPITLERSEKTAYVSFFTTTTSVLQSHLDSWKNESREPTFVSSIPIALVRYAKAHSKHLSSLYIFHIGEEKSTFVHMEKNIPKRAHTFEYGTENLKTELQNDDPKALSSKIDLSNIDQKKHPFLSAAFNSFQSLIQKTFSSISQSEEKLPLLITGDLEAFSNLKNTIFSLCEKGISSLLPDSKKEIESKKFKKHAIAIGLAFDALATDGRSLQFRQKAFTPRKVLRKKAFQVLSFVCFSCALTIFAHLTFEKILSQKREALSKQIELKIAKDDLFSYRKSKDFTDMDLEEKLDSWETSLQKESRNFPYYLNAYKVSDVLAWLQSNPELTFGEKNKILSFSYQLEKYPKIGSLSETFLVKVFLKLAIESDVIARKFHESLLKGDGPIDPKDMQWNVQGNIYETSFYLRNPK